MRSGCRRFVSWLVQHAQSSEHIIIAAARASILSESSRIVGLFKLALQCRASADVSLFSRPTLLHTCTHLPMRIAGSGVAILRGVRRSVFGRIPETRRQPERMVLESRPSGLRGITG